MGDQNMLSRGQDPTLATRPVVQNYAANFTYVSLTPSNLLLYPPPLE